MSGGAEYGAHAGQQQRQPRGQLEMKFRNYLLPDKIGESDRKSELQIKFYFNISNLYDIINLVLQLQHLGFILCANVVGAGPRGTNRAPFT